MKKCIYILKKLWPQENKMFVQKKKENCSGCGVCKLVCPHNAITMVKDEEGFLYPKVNPEKCTNCDLCRRVCHFMKKQQKEKNNDPKIFAVKNNDQEIRKKSSSGGVFSLLAEEMIKQGGSVYGALLDEDNHIIHSEITDMKDLHKLYGSKYVQSDLRNVYSEIKEQLSKGKKLLFSGTPCQLAGLKEYLGKKNNNNLILVDVICHGVSSPLIWESFVKILEQKNKSKLKNFYFRTKDFGWLESVKRCKAEFSDKKIVRDDFVNSFNNLFLDNFILRPSCHNCPYATIDREGDITLGDFYRVFEEIPSFYDDKGISTVVINTKKGEDLFNKIKRDVIYHQINKDQARQINLEKPTSRNKKRKKFWKDYHTKGYIFVAKKYTLYGLKNKIKAETKKLLIGILKKTNLFKTVKRILNKKDV